MKALISNVAFFVIMMFSACRDGKSRSLELSFSNEFRGAFTFEVDPNGVDVRGDTVRIAVPTNGVIRVKSLDFLYEWRHQTALRANGVEIPSFNDEPYNAQKVGMRAVYADDKKFVFVIGTQTDGDALRRLRGKRDRVPD